MVWFCDGSFVTLESASRKLQELGFAGVDFLLLLFSSLWGLMVELESQKEGLKAKSMS